MKTCLAVREKIHVESIFDKTLNLKRISKIYTKILMGVSPFLGSIYFRTVNICVTRNRKKKKLKTTYFCFTTHNTSQIHVCEKGRHIDKTIYYIFKEYSKEIQFFKKDKSQVVSSSQK